MKLLLNALVKLLFGFLFFGLLIFLPAGTIRYFGGLLFSALLFIPVIIMGVVLFIKAPELLKKRLSLKEKEKTQKGVVAAAALIFLFGFVLAGLDFRFSITVVTMGVRVAASIIFLLCYALYAEVMRENAYLSRTIEVQEGQRVVDTGLYSVVRHPMYAATVFMFLAVPLILGSWLSFIAFLFYPIVIAVRIKNEEKVLSIELNGYTEYMKKVKYRIIPFIW